MLNLDTNILIFFLDGKLRNDELALIQKSRFGVSSIVLWEFAKLRQKGRIAYGLNDAPVVNFLGRCVIWPIDSQVAIASSQLDFLSDPADEIIAATSIVHQVPLLTRDAKLRASFIVPLALK